jgi:hypothetical protein
LSERSTQKLFFLFIAAAKFPPPPRARMILVKMIKLALKPSNPDAEKLSRKNFSFRVGGTGKFFFRFGFIEE